MAYDEKLAGRVRELLGATPGLTEKRMFGGIAFLVNGNMAVGVHEAEVIVRLPADETDEALARPGVRVFDLSGGRPMTGWVLVDGAVLDDDRSLEDWLAIGRAYAGSLPPK